MIRYILLRLLQGLICLIAISIIVFSLVHISGDPVVLLLGEGATQEDYEEIKARLGLDKPLHIQYWNYISRAARGDLGESVQFNRPTLEVFADRFPATLQLSTVAMLWALIFGIPIGILSAVKLGTWFDKFGKVFALLGKPRRGSGWV